MDCFPKCIHVDLQKPDWCLPHNPRVFVRKLTYAIISKVLLCILIFLSQSVELVFSNSYYSPYLYFFGFSLIIPFKGVKSPIRKCLKNKNMSIYYRTFSVFKLQTKKKRKKTGWKYETKNLRKTYEFRLQLSSNSKLVQDNKQLRLEQAALFEANLFIHLDCFPKCMHVDLQKPDWCLPHNPRVFVRKLTYAIISKVLLCILIFLSQSVELVFSNSYYSPYLYFFGFSLIIPFKGVKSPIRKCLKNKNMSIYYRTFSVFKLQTKKKEKKQGGNMKQKIYERLTSFDYSYLRIQSLYRTKNS